MIINYHNIQTDDMMNGEGLRVTLFVSGCENYCENCQNKQTWDFESGINFNSDTVEEIIKKLDKPYISGITLSGGDPCNPNNIFIIKQLVSFIREIFGYTKTIWVYTGYNICNDVSNDRIINILGDYIDVIVDGKFMPEHADIKYPYAGSTNQRIIDVKKTLNENKLVLYDIEK